MSDFITFRDAVIVQLKKMEKTGELFEVDIDKSYLYQEYLLSFPEGTNPIFKERTEHDCNCCKGFIRNIGNVVAILDGKITSIWDISIGGTYQVVADTLASIVKGKTIKYPYRHYETNIGKKISHVDEVTTWDHFYHTLDRKFVMHKDSIPSFVGRANSSCGVFKRGLNETMLYAVSTVIDLISQGSLYRGEEHLLTCNTVKKLLVQYNSITNAKAKEAFIWSNFTDTNTQWVTGFRNTVIGTLLTDLSNNVDLEVAVKKFEDKVAPHNYKRPVALVTQGMIKKAEQKVTELGIEDALYRRYATTEDLTINNVLFADRSAKQTMGVFDSILSEAKTNKPNLDKIEEVSIEKFINNILPNAETIELLLENKHESNFVSLIAPKYLDSKGIFKWGNNFSWSYNGEVTDSVKEKVKRAGGNVTGDLRISLAWHNADDLDLHLIEPNNHKVYFSNRRSSYSDATLDVDMNAGVTMNKVDPVENITWDNKIRIMQGEHKVVVNNFCKRSGSNVGFTLEVEYEGEVKSYHFDKSPRNGQSTNAFSFSVDPKKGLVIKSDKKHTAQHKEIWGVTTNNFVKVDMVMNSPNHWDGEGTGNKHYFFMIDSCKNPEDTRGFYNEFLAGELNEHRKVFEVLASKLKVPYTDNQLSGIGFSSTQRNSVVCKVSGAFNRLIKINF